MINPLNEPLFQQLCDSPAGLGEYELLQTVKDHPALQPLAGSSNLALFQRHFFIMNSLYQLQTQLLEAGTYYLRISALNIQLQPLVASLNRDMSEAAEGKLRDYYLDWRNFETADAQSVDSLLRDFWQRYARFYSSDEALAALDLPANATTAEVKQRYRQLAARHHPDRGGDREQFVIIRQAYEALMG